MMNQNPPKPRRGRLKITQEGVVNIILYAIETDGLDAAKDFFDQMNRYCSTEPGWPETAREVRDIFAEERRRSEEAQQSASQAQVTNLIVNKVTGQDVRNIEQMNGFVESGAEVIHTKN